jgi:catechol 2,3-dioxygenase-like lactoylglutathione lyase family enzyme
MPFGLAELVLVVEDVPMATKFYRDIVGLSLQREPSDEWAWFIMGTDERPQRLALRKGSLLFEEHSPRPEGNRWGPVHFAFHVDQKKLPAMLDRLRTADIEIHGPVYFEWMNADSYYFYDPDDNLAEFWCPRSTD